MRRLIWKPMTVINNRFAVVIGIYTCHLYDDGPVVGRGAISRISDQKAILQYYILCSFQHIFYRLCISVAVHDHK